MFSIINLIIMLILGTLIILSFILQVKLSRNHSPLPGLVLPVVFTIVAFVLATFTTIYEGDLTPVIMAFFLYMIPADIHWYIYVLLRNNLKKERKDNIDKMNIQDL